MNLFEKILEYIFLPSCGICNKIGEGYLCKNCEKNIKKYKLMLMSTEKIAGNSIKKLYVLNYKDIIRNKIIEYKFYDKPYLYKLFSEIIIDDKKSCEFIKSYDIIIPVPIHKKRKKSRGYNQSELIARQLAKSLDLNMFTNILIKTSDNKVQSKLNKKERLENVKNVYKVINKEKIYNKNVLIIDDIYTTGATIRACAKELVKTDVNKIGVLIIAKD